MKNLLALLVLCVAASAVRAHGTVPQAPAPRGLAVAGALPALPQGVTDLHFNEMFKLPVGPRGLELSQKVLDLHGKRVRVVGYMAANEAAVPGQLILVPLPVSLTDEDESLADDLPPSAVFVHFAGPAASVTAPNLQGLIVLEGTLDVGAQDEPDGRVSGLRLLLDDTASAAIAAVAKTGPLAAASRTR